MVAVVIHSRAESSSSESESRGLVIDFDNAASLRAKEKRFPAEVNRNFYVVRIRAREIDAHARHHTQGTPGFAARSVSAASPLSTTAFVPMPTLRGKTKRLYIQAYSQEAYDRYNDTDLTWHGVPRELREDSTDYSHEPRHDAESVFWSLVYVLMKAPALNGAGPEDSLSDHARFTWRRLRGQGMPNLARLGGKVVDSRDVLLAYTEEDWANALAPGLAPVAPLLAKLAAQIQPEYALLQECPRKEHLHEAMRRLLLDHILTMEHPLVFPSKVRPIPLNSPAIDVLRDDCGYWPAHLLHLRPARNTIKLPGRRTALAN